MDAIKFSEKALSVFPMAYYFVNPQKGINI